MLKMLTFLLFFTLFGILQVPGVVYADYSPGGKDWMKNLDDDLPITQITIPGTHDSAADHAHCAENSACHAVIEFASTQTYDIQSQMEMGIRFFDVRLAYDKDGDRSFELHHGPYDLKQSIFDVIGWAKDFLEAHPSEFLIWLVKQEHTDKDVDAFWRDLSDIFEGYDDLFYVKKKILTVGEARGRVIVMARNHSSEYDQGYHVEWDKNTEYYIGRDSDLTYIAEDHYSLNYVYTSTKFIDIRRNLFLARACANCGSQDTLFFTFLSGEGDSAGKGPAHFADYENPHTADWLKEAGLGPRSGIVAMDFAGDNAHGGNEVLQALIGQNPPHRVPGWFGDADDGGGITVTDINQNGKPDLVVMNIHNPSGINEGYYRIGWDLNDYGQADHWGSHQSIPWWGSSQQGGGVTATDMNGDGVPDLIIFMLNNPDGENGGHYRIGYMDSDGGVTKWTDFNLIPGWWGGANEGGGITVTDINQNGRPDLVVMSIHDPDGENSGNYRIGWDLGSNGKTDNWSEYQPIPWKGFAYNQSGGGITAADADGDGTPDLMVYVIDNPDGANYGYYCTGYLDSTGTVKKWTTFEQDAEWIGGANNGGGITVDDIDQNGKLDLIPFVIYDLDGENRGYYRILWDQGTKVGSD